MPKRNLIVAIVILALVLLVLFLAMGLTNPTEEDEYPLKTREDAIPSGAEKVLPSSDAHPPVMHSSLWADPVPLAGPINTAGAEDSPFILPSGGSLYFFFTPDVTKSPQEQLFDEVTGVWRSDWNGTAWGEPNRVWLEPPGVLSLDGAVYTDGGKMWFASVREGYTGVNLFTAMYEDGVWTDWEYAGDLLNKDYQMGEMHISADGLDIYFHSNRSGGSGGLDIWVTHFVDGAWSAPENIEAVNTEVDEGWPFLNQDGDQLWFSRTYMGTPAIFMSQLVDGEWSEPELIVSSFAGEPTLDLEGNLYFVHHFYRDDQMIEADIYFAEKN